MHMSSQLRPLPSKLERDITKSLKVWRKPGTRTQYISGRHVYYMDLIDKMDVENGARQDQGQPLVTAKQHALAMRTRVDESNTARKARLHDKVLLLLQQKERSESERNSTFTFSSAAVSDSALLLYGDNVDTLTGSGALLGETAVTQQQWTATTSMHVLSADETHVARDAALNLLHR
eukprot:3918916-Amphidinium_carterae.1